MSVRLLCEPCGQGNHANCLILAVTIDLFFETTLEEIEELLDPPCACPCRRGPGEPAPLAKAA